MMRTHRVDDLRHVSLDLKCILSLQVGNNPCRRQTGPRVGPSHRVHVPTFVKTFKKGSGL